MLSSSGALLSLNAALVRRCPGEEAADNGDVTAVARPALPPLPPRAGIAAALRVAAIVVVAALADDGAVQPMEVVAPGLVGQQRRHEEPGQPAGLRRTAGVRLRHGRWLRGENLEVISGNQL